MQPFSLKELYLRWFRREASVKEQSALFEQAADTDPAAELNDAMYEAWTQLLSEMPKENTGSSPMAERIVKQFPAQAPVRQMNRPWLKVAVAAGVVAVLGATTYLLLPGSKTAQQQGLPVLAKADKAPGKEGALLTLADGSVVVLDSASDGLIARQGNASVRLANGNLVYENTQATTMAYNTMTTPRGRKFRLTLPDGTGVWLNAATTLRYPTAFPASERVVEVKGEAYFEVAKDPAKPFRVKTDGQLIEVLGTRFNVHAYAEEEELQTTLLAGKVSVAPASGQPALLLDPGYQAVSTRNEEGIRSLKADTLDVMSWKEGVFRFRKTPLILLLQQLERWYDVKVEGDIPRIHYTGVISRESSLSKVLNLLEQTGKARFRLEIQPEGSKEKDRITIENQ